MCLATCHECIVEFDEYDERTDSKKDIKPEFCTNIPNDVKSYFRY